jgi:agmatinase
MRRINEEAKPGKIIEVGIRAACREELNYAKSAGIEFITAQQIGVAGKERIINQLKEKLEGYKSVYVSIDMDVLDPAYAPAVQNPEPEGLDTRTLLDIVCGICDKRVLGFDVVEVAPVYDTGVTPIQAAKVIFEVLCSLEKSRRK